MKILKISFTRRHIPASGPLWTHILINLDPQSISSGFNKYKIHVYLILILFLKKAYFDLIKSEVIL